MTVLLEYIGKFSCEDLITLLLEEYIPPGNIFMFGHMLKWSCMTCRSFFFSLIFEVEKTFLYTNDKKRSDYMRLILGPCKGAN